MSTSENKPLGALADRLADLERDARGEVGLLIRARYTEALNAARLEAARRGLGRRTA